MKSSRIIYFVIICLMPFFWNGCEESGRVDYFDPDAPAPAQVSDVIVRPTHGGAVLKYTLPNDENLLYVWAEYEIRPGVVRNAKSSFFKDSLVLEGFSDERDYQVKIFSVGRNQKTSQPVIETVKPLISPVRLATRKMRGTFGGVNIEIENPENAELAIVLIADLDELGFMQDVFTFYTSMENKSFNYRGMEPGEHRVGVYIRDRWNNLSDTIYTEILALKEEEIPKTNPVWEEMSLPGDIRPLNSQYLLQFMWNEVWIQGGHREFHSVDARLPHSLTFRLNKTVRLSRLVLWPRNSADDRWVRGHPREFEVYGSMNPDYNSSSLDTWIPLGKFESIKPSGPGNQITQEDISAAQEGLEFDFEESDFATDPNNVSVRYIRIIVRSTFAYALYSVTAIQEISLHGVVESHN